MKKQKKLEERRLVTEGKVFVNASFNNTIVAVTDEQDQPLSWTSCGRSGFKGTRKSTPYAAMTALESAAEVIKNLGIRKVKVFIKGPGPGRDAALKVLGAKKEIDLVSISDVTPIPHNGPRPPKRRRA